ncbi:hypothetical protein HMI56_002298, partial [Coelomomyces lativittatus]
MTLSKETSSFPDYNAFDSGSEQFAFSCKWLNCDKNFPRLGDLVDHVKLAHCGLDQPFP